VVHVWWIIPLILIPLGTMTAYLILLYNRYTKSQRISPKMSAIPAKITPWRTTVSIGVLTPLANEAAQHLVEGLTEILSVSQRTTYAIVHLAGNNNRVTLLQKAEQAYKEHDVLITMGVHCGNIAIEAQQGSRTHGIIRTGLRHEQIKKLKTSDAVTTTIICAYNFAGQIKLLKSLKPETRLLCIVYRLWGEHTYAELAALEAACDLYGIKTITYHLVHHGHLDNQLNALGEPFDTLFVMPSTITAAIAQELITYCSAKKITLCSQEHDVVLLGGALGFSAHERGLGNQIGKLIRTMHEGKKEEIAPLIEHIPLYHCLINRKTAHAQGLQLAPECMTILEHAQLKVPPL